VKLLIDLISINYGRSGGVENYAYYFIDCLKNTDLKILIDVSTYSKSYCLNKYRSSKYLSIIYNPFLDRLETLVQFPPW
jgi:hypothetical protein